MIIRILFGLGTAFALVVESYAQFPGETAPGIKVSQEEINKVSHKRTHKQLPAKKKVAPPLDKQTAHKLRRFVSQFVLASCSRNANRDQRRFFAKHANYLGKRILVGQRSEPRSFDSIPSGPSANIPRRENLRSEDHSTAIIIPSNVRSRGFWATDRGRAEELVYFISGLDVSPLDSSKFSL
jgi:hypothetical protein